MKKHLPLITFSFLIAISFCQAQSPSLWGMTLGGGANDLGTIFSYDISTGVETDEYDFEGGTGGALGSLIQARNGLLYGLTGGGGAYEGGTIFSYDISTGTETKLHDFGGSNDGEQPLGSLIQASNGLLYGMTVYGGGNNMGTIFNYDISSGKETVLYGFRGDPDGQWPFNSLFQASDGLLYGMTEYGGSNGTGNIFSYDIATGTETDLHDFIAPDGNLPQGNLIEARNGLLYGMTEGGVNYDGNIFSYKISTRAETDLFDFGSAGTKGLGPRGSFVQARNGLLYGMSNQADTGSGIIFSYNISTGTETDLQNFDNGFYALNEDGSLIQASNGLLYGMANSGGAMDAGTIFSYDISKGKENDMHDFGAGTDGRRPYGHLIEVDDTTTGINLLATTSNNIQLYPNPSTISIHLDMTLQQEQPVVLSLYNTLGQQVWAEDLGKTKRVETTIPVAELANGVYVLKVNSGGESVQKEVVVEK